MERMGIYNNLLAELLVYDREIFEMRKVWMGEYGRWMEEIAIHKFD